MPLSSGTRLGPYEIVSPLGAGGMGEVYRARDARLGRDVAVKALPASAVLDPERVARFEREAQILGGLSHPHIAALYGLEQTASSQFLIMELVEGGTLDARLASGALPMRAAIDVGRQISDALQSAHDRGIIHRDLKPANVGFTADGHVKVLDFGLAKAHTVTSDADTFAAGTQSGVVLGTAAYMSPEQARGMPLDKRSDIFGFGCVLFEMLTGRNPFGAATISDIIVAILSREPDWTLLPPATPSRVQWLLRRCLEKDPRRRLHDMADARIELDEALVNPSDSGGIGTHPAALPAVRPRFMRRELTAWVIAALSLAAVVGVLAVQSRPPATDDTGRTYNALIQLPPLGAITFGNPTTSFAVSPDGRQLAFVGPGPDGLSMIWIRPLGSPVARPLAGTEGGTYPFWSPDSRFVGFIWRALTDKETSTMSGPLKRVESTGGVPVRIADVAFASVASWSPDGVILFTPAGNSALHRVSAEGGISTEATRLDASGGHVQHAHPFFLPDARRFLYTVVGSRTGATSSTGIHVASLDGSQEPRLLVEGASQGALARGHLFYLLGSTLMAHPFDPARLEFTGTASPVAERIVTASSGGGLISAYGVSASGVLVYQTMSPVRSQLAWFDRAGKPSGILGEQGDWVDVALSPDGARLATSRADPVSGSRDIWIFDVRRGLPERLTSAPSDDFAPVWSPGGEALIFSAARDGGINLFRTGLAGDSVRRIDDGGLALGKFAASWSPDGRGVLFIAGGRTIARSDLMLLPVEGGAAQIFLDSTSVETQGRFSPDGRWIAYASNASGRLEVYVKPYNRSGEARRVSEAGGRWPRWRRDSGEIVFMSPDDTLMSASLRITAEDVTVGEVRPLFKVRQRPQVRLDAYPYDMTPDAQRFIVNTIVEERNLPKLLTLITNWSGTGNR